MATLIDTPSSPAHSICGIPASPKLPASPKVKQKPPLLTRLSTISSKSITNSATEKCLQRMADARKRGEKHRRSDVRRVQTQLWDDVRNRRMDTLSKTLAHEGVKLSELDPQGRLLKSAVSLNFPNISKLLLTYNVPVVSEGDDGLSPLHLCIKLGHMTIFRDLVLRFAINLNMQSLYEKRTGVHMAIRSNSTEALRLLLERGADADRSDIYGSTPLHLAARLGREHLARMLIAHGASVTAIDNEGWTALHAAAEAGHVTIVRMLLKSHALVDAQSRFGKTSLHWAADNGHLAVVQELLDRHAATHIRDASDKLAVDYATSPLLRKLIQSYDKMTFPTSKDFVSKPKHEFIEYTTPRMSLIDLIDLSQYIDPYSEHINVDTIGRGALQDSLTKVNRLNSMPYLIQDRSETSPRYETPRPRAETMDSFGSANLTKSKTKPKLYTRQQSTGSMASCISIESNSEEETQQPSNQTNPNKESQLSVLWAIDEETSSYYDAVSIRSGAVQGNSPRESGTNSHEKGTDSQENESNSQENGTNVQENKIVSQDNQANLQDNELITGIKMSPIFSIENPEDENCNISNASNDIICAIEKLHDIVDCSVDENMAVMDHVFELLTSLRNHVDKQELSRDEGKGKVAVSRDMKQLEEAALGRMEENVRQLIVNLKQLKLNCQDAMTLTSQC